MEPEGFQGIHQSRIKRFVYIIVGALCVSIGFYLVLVAVFIICGFCHVPLSSRRGGGTEELVSLP